MSHRAIVFKAVCKPEHREAFIARAQEHASVVHAEPGCLRCDVLVPDEAHSNTIFLYELFEDEHALKVHSEMPYMSKWREDIDPMLESREPIFVIVTNE